MIAEKHKFFFLHAGLLYFLVFGHFVTGWQ